MTGLSWVMFWLIIVLYYYGRYDTRATIWLYHLYDGLTRVVTTKTVCNDRNSIEFQEILTSSMPDTHSTLCALHISNLNPFPPSVPIWHRLAKLSILILEGIIKKNSYERHDYESVDEKSLS